MNKHTLQQRLRSIEHYTQEIQDMEAAVVVTRQTRKDLIDSLVEACPFSNGQIILREDRIRKIDFCKEVCLSGTGYMVWVMYASRPANSGGWQSSDEMRIRFDEVEQWKIVS